MHWTVLLVSVWLYFVFWDVLATAIGWLAFCVVLMVHECGHLLLLRRYKVAVSQIELFGLHGKTSHEWVGPTAQMFIAWGGVAAQLLLLLCAGLVGLLLPPMNLGWGWRVIEPILLVFTKINLFLLLVALLPIGPFDGNHAWAIIPWLRQTLRQRRRAAREAKSYPERQLTPEKRAELEARSAQEAKALLDKLGKQTRVPKDNA
jgi:Zn-dependent protease